MILKTIYIQGFKSFLNKTKIDFNNSITGIVGPNGSGKSNITDAITWVLGETSIKNLRGSKMEDVIFSGTDKRHATGFAEVSIVFDNSDKSIPLEFEEVQITRRMYRSLESEFLINGTKCRLKDIRELFLDTGIGKDGYSLIGQGQIDKILSNKPDERRQIFEEAAGVSKYKLRKHESELKLKRTKENILRLSDIVSELELREKDLKNASDNAKIYKEKIKELKEIEIKSASFELLSLAEKIKLFQEELNHSKEKNQINLNNFESIKNNIEDLSEKFTKADLEVDFLKKKVNDTEFALQKEVSDLDIIKIKIANNKKNLESDNNSLKEIENSLEKAKNKLIEIQSNKEVEKELQCEVEVNLNKLNDEIKELLENISEKQKLIDSHNLGLKNIENEITSIKSKLSMLSLIKAEKANRLSNIKNNLNTLEANNLEIEQLKNENQKSYQDCKAELISIRKDIEFKIEEKAIKIDDLKKYDELLKEINKNLSQKEAQYNALKSLSNSFEGYNKSVKSLMNVTKRGEFSNEIIGPVAENFDVKKEYETAISVALGAALQNVIVDKLNSAKKIIDYLNRQKMGRITFLPMDSMSYKNNKVAIKNNEDIIGFADELIEYKPEFENIFKNLLGKTLVAKDFNSGSRLSNQFENKYRIVTLRGDSFNLGGSVTGGSLNKYTSEILSRKNELVTLKNEIDELYKELKLKQKGYEEINSIILKLENEILELKSIETKLSEKLIKFENNLSSLKSSMQSNKIYIEKYQMEEAELSKQIEEDYKNFIELENRQDILQKEINYNSEFNDDGELKKLQNQLEELKDKKINITVLINEYAAKINTLNREIEIINENEISYENSKKSLIDSIQILSKQIDDLNDDLKGRDEKLDLLKNDKIDFEEKLSASEEFKNKIYLDLKEKRSEMELLQENRISEESEIAKLESKIERFEDRVQIINENILENYGEVELLKEIDEKDIKDSKNKISILKKEIESLGIINLGAIEEYAVLMERLEFTRNQITDMLESKREIEEIIIKLESEMKILFANTFNKVSKYFEEIFKILFNGGRAKIELEDNTLESGIEIKAEPPGKKLQSLSLLSGGERALTAVALLFALLKVRPAPFCILDEIDAALDDANIKKYADYLMTLEGTQFIIITHRKITMEIANVLYGITMEEKGISKIISVKLD